MAEYPIEIELVYSNGTPVTSDQLTLPYFGDVSVIRTAAQKCEELLRESEKYDHPIRNDEEAQKVIDYIADLRKQLKEIKRRIAADISPWQRVIDQIKESAKKFILRFNEVEEECKDRLANYQTQKKVGRLLAAERSKQKEEAKLAEAQYTDDPKKAHRAKLEAKAWGKEARSMVKSPVLPGMDTEEYLKEIVILNRAKAAAMPEDAINVSPNYQWFVTDIKEKKKAGAKIWDHMYPGLELVFGTRVRLPRQ